MTTTRAKADRAEGHDVPVLSPRDLEVLRHLAAGRSTSQIAAAMRISTNTVRARIHRLEARLVVTARVDVVPRARVLGVV